MSNEQLMKKIRELLPESERKLAIIPLNKNYSNIMVGKSEYVVVKKNNNVELYKVVRSDTNVNITKVTSNKNRINKKIKTKKAKAKMAQKVRLGLCVIGLTLASCAAYKAIKTPKKTEVVVEIDPSIPRVESIPKMTIPIDEDKPIAINERYNNSLIVNNKGGIMASPVPSYEINKKENVMVDLTSVSKLNENPQEKRKKVLERFPYIPKYLEDVGISPEIGICLVSQESGDESYPYKDQFQNIWQLTNSIIDEPMKVPLVNGKEGEFRKIYVYSPEKEDTVKEAYKLKKDGYLIFSIKEAKENPEINTLIATTYLAHCINRTGSLFGGMVAYNSGYGVVKNYSNEELLAGAVRNSDPKYLEHVMQYASENDIVIGWHLWKNGEISYNQTTIHIDGLVRPLEEENEEVKHHI